MKEDDRTIKVERKWNAMHLGWMLGAVYGLCCIGPAMTHLGLLWGLTGQHLDYFDGLLATVIGAGIGLFTAALSHSNSKRSALFARLAFGQIGAVLIFSPLVADILNGTSPIVIWFSTIFIGLSSAAIAERLNLSIRTNGTLIGLVVGSAVGWLLLEYPIRHWLIDTHSYSNLDAKNLSVKLSPACGAILAAPFGWLLAPIARVQTQNRITTPFGIIATILAFGMWLIPMGLTGTMNARLAAYPAGIRNQFRIACLFTSASRSWPTVHYEVLQDGTWREGPLEGFFDIDIFGYRTRFNRIVTASRKKSKYVMNLENISQGQCLAPIPGLQCDDSGSRFRIQKPDEYFELKSYSQGCLTAIGHRVSYRRSCKRNPSQQWKLRNKHFNGVKGFQIKLHESNKCLSLNPKGQPTLQACRDTEEELWKKSTMVAGKNRKRLQEIVNYIGKRWSELNPDETPIEAVRITIARHPVGGEHCMAKEAWSRPEIGSIPKKHLRPVGVFSVLNPVEIEVGGAP